MQNIDESSTILEKKDADILHSVVAKLLWVAKGGRINIEPAISFLCTRVTKITKEDREKLRLLFKYLKHTINNKRIMGEDSLSQLCTWVDAAYGVHPDLKSHTGGCMSFGYGMVHCNYCKQKLNTKSSTEEEVVGISDYLTYNIWICLFMGAKGYDIKQNILFQDNQSEMKMEKNGRKSCTGNSRHIYIRYFFAK